MKEQTFESFNPEFAELYYRAKELLSEDPHASIIKAGVLVELITKDACAVLKMRTLEDTCFSNNERLLEKKAISQEEYDKIDYVRRSYNNAKHQNKYTQNIANNVMRYTTKIVEWYAEKCYEVKLIKSKENKRQKMKMIAEAAKARMEAQLEAQKEIDAAKKQAEAEVAEAKARAEKEVAAATAKIVEAERKARIAEEAKRRAEAAAKKVHEAKAVEVKPEVKPAVALSFEAAVAKKIAERKAKAIVKAEVQKKTGNNFNAEVARQIAKRKAARVQPAW